MPNGCDYEIKMNVQYQNLMPNMYTFVCTLTNSGIRVVKSWHIMQPTIQEHSRKKIIEFINVYKINMLILTFYNLLFTPLIISCHDLTTHSDGTNISRITTHTDLLLSVA